MSSHLQITADQIVSEAFDTQPEQTGPTVLETKAELIDFIHRQRTYFEDQLRSNANHAGTWLTYATFERQHGNMDRSRSIFERALVQSYENPTIYADYAELECLEGNPIHARNIYERAIRVLPRCAFVWLRYLLFEEVMKNYAGTRHLFDRWMMHAPPVEAWREYVSFETRCGELERVREVYGKWIGAHPTEESFTEFANSELKRSCYTSAVSILEKALVILEASKDDNQESFLNLVKLLDNQSSPATLELCLKMLKPKASQKLYHLLAGACISSGDIKKARKVYLIGLKRLNNLEQRAEILKSTLLRNTAITKILVQIDEELRQAVDFLTGTAVDINSSGFELNLGSSKELYMQYLGFERMHGDFQSVAEAVATRRLNLYNKAIAQGSRDPSVFLNIIKMGESEEIYSSALARTPQTIEELKGYMYICYFYVLYRELNNRDGLDAIDVLEEQLNALELCKLKPSYSEENYKMGKNPIFGKLEILRMRLHIMKSDLDNAEKVWRVALLEKVTLAKTSLAREGARILVKNGRRTAVRSILEKYLSRFSNKAAAWILVIDFEQAMGEEARAVALCEAAEQISIDEPAIIWSKHVQLLAKDSSKVKEVYVNLLRSTDFRIGVQQSYIYYLDRIGDIPQARSELIAAAERYHMKDRQDDRRSILSMAEKIESQWLNQGLEQSDTNYLAAKARAPKLQDGQWIFPEDSKKEEANRLLLAARAWNKIRASE